MFCLFCKSQNEIYLFLSDFIFVFFQVQTRSSTRRNQDASKSSVSAQRSLALIRDLSAKYNLSLTPKNPEVSDKKSKGKRTKGQLVKGKGKVSDCSKDLV